MRSSTIEAPQGGSQEADDDRPNVTYLTTEQLAARIHYDPRTIRTRLKDTKLLEGVHYIRPFGGRKLLFVWEAIEREFNLAPVPAAKLSELPAPPMGPAPEVAAAAQAGRAAMDAARQALEAANEAIEAAQRAHAGAPAAGSVRAAHKPGDPVLSPPPAGWSEAEIVQLVATGGSPEALAALAEATGRSPRSVRERWSRLMRETNIKPRTNARAPILRWTQEELEWLRAHYANASAEDLVVRFPHRRLIAIRIRASEMGLTLPRKVASSRARDRKKAGSLGPMASESEPVVA